MRPRYHLFNHCLSFYFAQVFLTACSSDPRSTRSIPPASADDHVEPADIAAGSRRHTAPRFSTDEAWHIETAAGEENADPWFEIDPMQERAGRGFSYPSRCA